MPSLVLELVLEWCPILLASWPVVHVTGLCQWMALILSVWERHRWLTNVTCRRFKPHSKKDRTASPNGYCVCMNLLGVLLQFLESHQPDVSLPKKRLCKSTKDSLPGPSKRKAPTAYKDSQGCPKKLHSQEQSVRHEGLLTPEKPGRVHRDQFPRHWCTSQYHRLKNPFRCC